MNKKKIAILTPKLPPQIEGVAQYSYRLAKALRKAGHESFLISSRGEGEGLSENWIHAVVDKWTPEHVALQLRSLPEKPDVCIFQYVPQLYGRYGINFFSARIPEMIQKKLKIQTAVTIHEYGGENKDTLKDRFFAVLLRRQARSLLRGTQLVFTTCGRYVDELSRLEVEVPILAIPVGSHIEDAGADDESLKLLKLKHHLKGEILVGVLGRLSEPRNFPTAIRTLHFLKKKGAAVKLLILGNAAESNPLLFERLLVLIRELDLEQEVIVTGALEEAQMSRYLRLLDVLLFPQCDGLSTRNTSVMSALSHGLPILSYPPEEGNFDDYVLPYGGIAKRGHEEAFLNCAYDFIKGDARNSEKRKANRDYFNEKFSWEIIAQSYLDGVKRYL